MKISVLLPYKENYHIYMWSSIEIFVNSTIKLSKFKNITVYGSLNIKKFYQKIILILN